MTKFSYSIYWLNCDRTHMQICPDIIIFFVDFFSFVIVYSSTVKFAQMKRSVEHVNIVMHVTYKDEGEIGLSNDTIFFFVRGLFIEFCISNRTSLWTHCKPTFVLYN